MLRVHFVFESIFLLSITALMFTSCCSVYPLHPIENYSAMIPINKDSLRVANAIESMDTAMIPEYLIYINLHFVRHQKIGNFYRGHETDHNLQNGMHWTSEFMRHLNYQLDHLVNSKTSLENFNGNARYNIKIYSDPMNSKDSFGGIWFWDAGFHYRYPYGDTVLNLVFLNDETRKLNGAACGLNMCNNMTLYGAYDNIVNKGIFGWWSFAGLFNHELGHLFGLCHSFYCNNECNGLDLDVAKECVTNPCFDDCGGPNGKACNNWDSGSSNIMGYNPDQNSLTPCQWKHIMHKLYNTNVKYVKRVENFNN